MDNDLNASSKLLRDVCHLAAEAAFRYVEISGEDPGQDMPESFLSSFVFDRVGATATLETSIGKLFEWNRDQRLRTVDRVTAMEEVVAEVSLPLVLESLNGRPRVDLVLFQGESPVKKDEQRLLALVEFKRHRLCEQDRNKLLAILDHIDTCRWGVICSVLDVTSEPEWLQKEKQQAEAAGDRWFVCDVPALPHGRNDRHFVSCLRAFTRRKAIG